MDLKNTIGQMLDKTLILAKQQREKIPYSHVDGFPQSVLVLGPSLEVATLPAVWRNEREKYAVMRLVSETARDSLATAVLFVTDTRWVDSTEISARLGIPTVEDIGLEAWQTRYKRVVTERFKGYVGNMPSEWYREAIMTLAKGPTIGKMARAARYEKGPHNSIKWLEGGDGLQDSFEPYHFDLLPDWWC